MWWHSSASSSPSSFQSWRLLPQGCASLQLTSRHQIQLVSYLSVRPRAGKGANHIRRREDGSSAYIMATLCGFQYGCPECRTAAWLGGWLAGSRVGVPGTTDKAFYCSFFSPFPQPSSQSEASQWVIKLLLQDISGPERGVSSEGNLSESL